MRCQMCALSMPSLGEWHAAVGLSCLTQTEEAATVSLPLGMALDFVEWR